MHGLSTDNTFDDLDKMNSSALESQLVTVHSLKGATLRPWSRDHITDYIISMLTHNMNSKLFNA